MEGNLDVDLGLKSLRKVERGSPGVVRVVTNLFKEHPNKFIKSDLSSWPLPRIEWKSGLKLPDGKRLRIGISKEIRDQILSITICDFDLPPGRPIDKGEIAYRVDITGGEAAQRYKKSTGFVTSQPAFVFGDSGSEAIISDNWAETKSGAEDVIALLKSGNLFRPA